MQTKFTFFTEIPEQEIIKAYKAFYLASDDEKVIFEGKEVTLDFIASGGSKSIFGLNEDDEIALATFSITSDGYWKQILREEVILSKQAREAGLYAQNYEEALIYFQGKAFPVLKMPTFKWLVSKGLQARDFKQSNVSKYGTSMLFGTLVNLQNPEYWEKLLGGFQEDFVIYFSGGFYFEADSFNLAIIDSAETPVYDRSQLGTVLDRKQKMHMYFYDFSSKASEYIPIKYGFLCADGTISREAVEKSVIDLFERRLNSSYSNLLFRCLLKEEYVNILGENYFDPFKHVHVWDKAKPTIDIIQPSFVKSVTDKIIQKLAALPPGILQQRFQVYEPYEPTQDNTRCSMM